MSGSSSPIIFSTAKDTKKHLFFFVSFRFTYLSFFLFLMPCFHKAASCSLGMQEAKLVWMNCLLFSFFIITKFLCVFNSFPAIFFFLFRVFFYTHNFSILYEFNPFVFYIKIILYHKLTCAIIIRYRMGVQYSKREGCKVWK